MSEGRRQIAMGAVKLNGFVVTNFNVKYNFHVGDVIEVGKRKFEVTSKDLECVEV